MDEKNDESWGTFKNNSQTSFKTSILKQSLRNYNGSYITVNSAIRIDKAGLDNGAKRLDKINKRVIVYHLLTARVN